MTHASLTLVTGATGKTGRRVADQLESLGHAVRRASRSADIPFDWDKPETWTAALAGVQQVYVAYHPDLAAPGALEIIRAFTQAAVEAGVQKLVLLSGRGEPAARAAERVVAASGLVWAVVRASWFAQNFTEGDFAGAVLSGTLALPAPGDVPEPFIDVEDIVAVAVAALTSDRLEGRVHEVTGPRALTLTEAVEELGRVLGRELRFVQVSAAEFEQGMTAHGVPQELAAFLSELMGTVLDGRNVQPSSGVEKALGRAPRDFAETLRRELDSGRWQVA